MEIAEYPPGLPPASMPSRKGERKGTMGVSAEEWPCQGRPGKALQGEGQVVLSGVKGHQGELAGTAVGRADVSEVSVVALGESGEI